MMGKPHSKCDCDCYVTTAPWLSDQGERIRRLQEELLRLAGRIEELEANLAKRVFRLENALIQEGILRTGLKTKCPTCNQETD